MAYQTLTIAVFGCGGFGHFALMHFMQVPGVRLAGIAATAREASLSAAKRFNAKVYASEAECLADPLVDLIYIATPPFLHYQQVMDCLNAGKHVICEKPLAMNMQQAEEMQALAQQKGLLMVTNLMQRYNPLYTMVQKACKEELLGKPLHGFFENYASDEGLGPQHWFWDRALSGGLFVEHGVHFFDAFAGWLGPGEVLAAQVFKRPGAELEESVNATLGYGDGVSVNFYHGFTQTGRMDRQTWRLLFELGEITLHEWVPTRADITALVNEERAQRLEEIFAGSHLRVQNNFGHQHIKGRHKEHDAYMQISLQWEYADGKGALYGDLLVAMLTDQLAYLRNPTHKRLITEANGVESLRIADIADRLAHGEQAPVKGAR